MSVKGSVVKCAQTAALLVAANLGGARFALGQIYGTEQGNLS